MSNGLSKVKMFSCYDEEISKPVLCVNLQIWDFNLGQSRGPEDTGRMEAAYVTKGAASFTINNFFDVMNETCSTNAKGVKEICKVIVLINLRCFSIYSLTYYSLRPLVIHL